MTDFYKELYPFKRIFARGKMKRYTKVVPPNDNFIIMSCRNAEKVFRLTYFELFKWENVNAFEF